MSLSFPVTRCSLNSERQSHYKLIPRPGLRIPHIGILGPYCWPIIETTLYSRYGPDVGSSPQVQLISPKCSQSDTYQCEMPSVQKSAKHCTKRNYPLKVDHVTFKVHYTVNFIAYFAREFIFAHLDTSHMTLTQY